ncbi:hypothetical protein PO587_43640 [Streptomyces gilvifuscus]|uniref:Uncharacterized protein n=1 Tax=Streptomyces gilvifuscus TaxID=1550617 RepID=A0ABT5G9A2_9ACTN|nr:hypothetical protein [Streptomyces gilvifuscus]MDC2961339.1 hypothetical protein [Streptomyces gilvifuscus]
MRLFQLVVAGYAVLDDEAAADPGGGLCKRQFSSVSRTTATATPTASTAKSPR